MISKRLTGIFSVAAVLLSTLIHAQKNEPLEFVKERAISKSYSAGNSLSIDNQFGHIKIITWDKNEIKVDVAIKAESSDKGNAEATFESIDVKDSESGGRVRFKTEIKNNNYNCHNCKTNMRINYEVHLPVTVSLTLNNSFGNIEIPDYKGPVDLSNKFGNVTAGALTDVKGLSIEFGKGQLKSLTDVNVTFKFSKIQLESLSGTNRINMEFCDSSKVVLASNLSSLTLNESYSTVNLKPAGNLAATYEIKTSFGNFVDRSDIGVVRTDTPDRYGPDSDRMYEGKSGNGATKISVRSSFGKIILGDAKPEDMKKTTNAGGKKKTSRVI